MQVINGSILISVLWHETVEHQHQNAINQSERNIYIYKIFSLSTHKV